MTNPESYVAPVELKVVSDGAPGEFVAYGAVFGNIDSHGDRIDPGAFTASLAEHKRRGTAPGLFIEHGPFVGGDSLPAGEWLHLEEDAKGLKGRGRIGALDSDYGKRVLGLMRDGIMRGVSIAFRVPPGGAVYGRSQGEPNRILKAVDLQAIDIVRQPSNPLARVEHVKSLASRAELEDLLRSTGLARGAARKIAEAGWPRLNGEPEQPDEDPQLKSLFDVVKAAAHELKARG